MSSVSRYETVIGWDSVEHKCNGCGKSIKVGTEYIQLMLMPSDTLVANCCDSACIYKARNKLKIGVN